MNRIEAKYLTKVYKNGAYGLKNCSLNIERGEFLVVLGASGSGKSTLLKVLAGTERLSCGELYFDGILSENIPTSKRDVSMVFQEYVLYPHMTVFDNLATPLKLKGEDEKSIYDRIMQVAHVLNLDNVVDVKPKFLSGGEQQRVALAKAILKQSKLVLLDEPMSNVDEKSRWEYCRLLEKTKKMLPDSTFVYVTHNIKEALFLADRIAVMDDGSVLQIANKDYLIKHAESLLAMEIMGCVERVSTVDCQQEPIDSEFIEDLDDSKVTRCQKAMLVKSSLDNQSLHLFDENGKSLHISSTELKMSARLKGNILEFGEHSIELDDEYMARLLARQENVDVVFSVDKFSKTMLSNGFSMVFEVVKNAGNYVVLSTNGNKVILARSTGLKVGEKIRLYYRLEDLNLYNGEERLTCHYPLHRNVAIKIYDNRVGKVELLGKRIKLNSTLNSSFRYAIISEDSFEISYKKGRCAVRVTDCLDEEFINGKKLMHVAIKGVEGYLSFIASRDITCFGKDKVWLNIVPKKLIFTVSCLR